MHPDQTPQPEPANVSQQRPTDNNSVRIDRWLWAARFFKTRAMASDAVKKGHVNLNGKRCKPAKTIVIADELRIRKDTLEFIVLIDGLSVKRLSAPLAQALYAETPDSIDKRQQQSENQRLLRQGLRHSTGRPNKKDRRNLLKQKFQQ